MNASSAVMVALREREVPYFTRTKGSDWIASFDAKFGANWARIQVIVSQKWLVIAATIDVPSASDVTRIEELVGLVNDVVANGKFEYRPGRGHIAFEVVIQLGHDSLAPDLVSEAIGRMGRSFVWWRPLFLDEFHGGADFTPAVVRVRQFSEYGLKGDDRAFRTFMERSAEQVGSESSDGDQI